MTVYQLATVTLPKDVNANGIPDAGWMFINTVSPREYRLVADSNSLAIASDDDVTDPPGAVLPDPFGTPKDRGITGDGLTALEEYRGFVVNDLHTRTNPYRKDLFVDLDSRLLVYDSIFLSLPLTFHYLSPKDSQTDTNGLHPLINGNRATAMTGASAQYGLSVRQRSPGPMIVDDATGVPLYPAYASMLGRAFQVGESLTAVPYTSNRVNATPNETLVVEIYPRAFGNEGITHSPGQRLYSIPICNDPSRKGCDTYDLTNDEIYPGDDQVLDTERDSRDLGIEILSVCNGGYLYFIDADYASMKTAVLAHEGGHGLMVDHAEYYVPAAEACGQTVMYSIGTVSPVPAQFQTIDKQQIRLHLKHP